MSLAEDFAFLPIKLNFSRQENKEKVICAFTSAWFSGNVVVFCCFEFCFVLFCLKLKKKLISLTHYFRMGNQFLRTALETGVKSFHFISMDVPSSNKSSEIQGHRKENPMVTSRLSLINLSGKLGSTEMPVPGNLLLTPTFISLLSISPLKIKLEKYC